MQANAKTLVSSRSSNQSHLFQKGVSWMWGNIPRVLLSACAVIKRAKPVIIIAYTPTGWWARLGIAMQIQPVPCNDALPRHRCQTLQTPLSEPGKQPALAQSSRGALRCLHSIPSRYASERKVQKVKWQLEDSESDCVFRNRRNSWKVYGERISNNVLGLCAAGVRLPAGVTVCAKHLCASSFYLCRWSNLTSC